MRKNLFVVFLLVIFAAVSFAQTGRIFDGKVVAVADGDTVTVLDASQQQHKIRLAGIDAPESKQDFGAKAKQNLSDLVYGKAVTVFGGKIDKYGRLVGKIVVDGLDINLEQIKSGFAWHYKQYENEQSAADRTAYADTEIAARKLKVKIWSVADPVAPWDFRANIRASKRSTSKTKIADPAYSPPPAPVRTESRRYIRGPRGGCYYINSNGNKSYVSRSLCS